MTGDGLRYLAAILRATEAALVVDDGEFRVEHHLRPDDSDPDLKQRARDAFLEIARRGIERNADLVVEIDGTRSGNLATYCIACIEDDRSRMSSAVLLILRCNEADATDSLRRLRALRSSIL